jgi:biofilm PGA synthesis N-glycosyltransferase PgaC
MWIEYILLFLLATSFIYTLVYQLYFWPKKLVEAAENKAELAKGLSIVLTIKDDEENIKRHLSHFLDQNHPNFEVVVVDDHSTDNSVFVIEELKKSYPMLKTVYLTNENTKMRGLKLATTLGIKASKFESILLSNINCKPRTNNWAKRMHEAKTKGIQVVSGFTYHRGEESFSNLLLRVHSLFNESLHLNLLEHSKPYSCGSCNLLVSKELFLSSKGFAPNLYLPFGEFELLFNKIATPTNSKAVLHPESFISQRLELKKYSFIKEIAKQTVVENLFINNTNSILYFYKFFHVVFYPLLLLAIGLFSQYYLYFIGVFIAKVAVNLLYYYFNAKRTGQLRIVLLIPIVELIHILVLFLGVAFGRFKKASSWK